MGKITALTEFNRKNSGVNDVQPKRYRRYGRFLVGIKKLTAFTGKTAALTACNPKNSGVNGFFCRYEGVNGV